MCSAPSKNENLDKLTWQSKRAIKKLMQFESSKTDGFLMRAKNFKSMYAFDWLTRKSLSELLQSQYPVIRENIQSSLFDSHSDVDSVINCLEKNGYAISENTFKHPLPIEKLIFQPRDNTFCSLNGKDLLDAVQQNNPDKLKGTYWLDEQNTIVQVPEFIRLAFDPYILSIVSAYLGCTPIHVQTNLWFSFAGEQNKKERSRNAQFFHQDKEFVKFIKVFIYLNDVTADNGAHCYIEGSHIDELNQHHIPYSTRVSDEQIFEIYGKDKLRVIEGKAGTVIFGDTVSVHKGQAPKSGSRLILQLEYAASLYMSPVCPFEDLNAQAKQVLPSELLRHTRLFANYSSESRQNFLRAAQKTALHARIKKRFIRLFSIVLKKI